VVSLLGLVVWWFGDLVVFNDDVQVVRGFFCFVSKVSVRRIEEIWEILIWSD
jgi:hypothetical protein